MMVGLSSLFAVLQSLKFGSLFPSRGIEWDVRQFMERYSH